MYLTLEYLIDRYGAREIVELSNDRFSGTVDASDLKAYAELDDPSPGASANILTIAEFVNERIKDAEAFAMSYVHAAYRVTEFDEDTVPRDLRLATAKIARYYLHENRMNTRVRQGYEDALSWLESRKSLGVNDAGKKHRQTGVLITGGSLSDDKSRIFTEDSEKRFTEGYN